MVNYSQIKPVLLDALAALDSITWQESQHGTKLDAELRIKAKRELRRLISEMDQIGGIKMETMHQYVVGVLESPDGTTGLRPMSFLMSLDSEEEALENIKQVKNWDIGEMPFILEMKLVELKK
jgi:hypothetical protein